MNRRLFLAAAGAPIIGAWLGGERAWALDAGDRTFARGRVGAIVKGSTKPADLERIYGAANVRREKIHDPGGGEESPGAFIYKETDDSLELTFSDDEARIEQVTVLGQKWTGPQGLKVGMPLAQLQRIYGAAFKFHGFGWDYGGQILSKPKALDGISVFMAITRNLETRTAQRVMGETEFSANHPALKNLGVAVSLIHVAMGA